MGEKRWSNLEKNIVDDILTEEGIDDIDDPLYGRTRDVLAEDGFQFFMMCDGEYETVFDVAVGLGMDAGDTPDGVFAYIDEFAWAVVARSEADVEARVRRAVARAKSERDATAG